MTGQRRHRCGVRSAGADGFTLVELLVVMAILAAVVLMVAPVTSRLVAPQVLRTTASDLAALLRQTRAAAVRSGLEHTMSIDLAARSYWSEGIAPARQLPSGLGLELLLPSGGDGTASGVRRIRFQPSGGASGGRIVLRQGARAVQLDIDWLTGGVHVASSAP